MIWIHANLLVVSAVLVKGFSAHIHVQLAGYIHMNMYFVHCTSLESHDYSTFLEDLQSDWITHSPDCCACKNQPINRQKGISWLFIAVIQSWFRQKIKMKIIEVFL